MYVWVGWGLALRTSRLITYMGMCECSVSLLLRVANGDITKVGGMGVVGVRVEGTLNLRVLRKPGYIYIVCSFKLCIDLFII